MELQINKTGMHARSVYPNFDPRQKMLALGALFVFIFGIILTAVMLPNGKEVKPYQGDIGLVVNGNIIETKNHPIIENSEVLLSFNDIKNTIDKNIWYDDKNKKVTVTTESKVIRIIADKNTGSINNKLFVMNRNMRIVNGVVYIPIESFKDFYDIDVKYIKDNNVVVVENRSGEFKYGASKSDDKAIRKASIGKKTPSTIKEPILKKLKKGEQVKIVTESKDWYKVEASNGTVGYIQKKYIVNVKTQNKKAGNQTQYQAWKPSNGKINLVWDQIEKVTPVMDNVDKVDGLDVVVPTWFNILDGKGTIKNKADSAYVRWARANGYKVWGLATNITKDYKSDNTSEFLENADTREKVINDLLNLSELYELDGINIDFEYVKEKNKPHVVEFMRELAPVFREKGLAVSIDVTVKVNSPNSNFFDRKALSDAVDYVVLMSYDQHWDDAPESGSVAQYIWVDSNVSSLLKEIPKEKFIMGIPFYTRQWTEEAGKKNKSDSISMAKTQNIIRQNNATVIWDEESGQYYAEFSKNNKRYRIWIEDVKSIDLKSSLVLKYDLAGTASWRRGYETSNVWPVLKRNLKDFKNYNQWKSNSSK